MNQCPFFLETLHDTIYGACMNVIPELIVEVAAYKRTVSIHGVEMSNVL